MRLVLLISFTMIAFASNSVLTRMAIEHGETDAISFALIRVLSGAVILWALVMRRHSPIVWRSPSRVIGALSLSLYMIGFSLAYTTLDAGLGALILFGVVQISMFSYGAFVGARPSQRQVLGAVVAFVGLIVALWPDETAKSTVAGMFFMILAGLGWAVYTLSGKNARNPLAETAANFVLCLPVLGILGGAFVQAVSLRGVILAVICGAITSGLGYALWYRVLPDLQRSTAAVVQLSVPIIAILAGAVILDEPITLTVMLAAVLVIAGIGMAVTRQSAPADRR